MKIQFSIVTIFLFLLNGLSAQSPNSYTYTGKPRFQILTKRNNVQLGIINVELFPNIAPKHTRNFDSLVSVQFYDTTAFHRVIPNFMIQGGDPNSRHGAPNTWGQGQIGQPTVPAEFSAAQHIRGRLSAARKPDINSATSQFFICHAAASWLDGNYSIYGRVTHGINYVDTIALAPRDGNDRPLTKIEMFITYIGSNDTIPVAPLQEKPVNDSIEVDTMLITWIKWKRVSDAILYQFQFSADSTFNTTLYNLNTPNLQYGIPAGLSSGTKYYWRVRTNNGGHFSPWSPKWHFRTMMPLNDVGILEQGKESQSAKVYPNPGQGIFHFTELEKDSRLEIYDMTGKKIIDQKCNTETQVQIEQKGIYTYRVRSKNSKKNGKIVVR